MASEQEWRQFFDAVDVNKSGSISCSELEGLLTEINKAMEKDASPAEIKAEAKDILEACDSDGSGDISWDEFCSALKSCQSK